MVLKEWLPSIETRGLASHRRVANAMTTASINGGSDVLSIETNARIPHPEQPERRFEGRATRHGRAGQDHDSMSRASRIGIPLG